MIHDDKVKLNAALLEAKELKDNDLNASMKILDDILQVANSNPEIAFRDEYLAHQSRFESINGSSEWQLAKASLIEQIETINNRFCR